jgi:hypothetical protein
VLLLSPLWGIWLALTGCAPDPLAIRVELDRTGAVVRANHPLEHVELRDDRGALVVARTPEVPTDAVTLRAPLRPGTVTVQARSADASVVQDASLPDPGAFAMWVEAPLGQSRRSLTDDDAFDVDVPVPVGGTVRIGVGVESQRNGRIAWDIRRGSVREPGESGATWVATGERAVIPVTVDDETVVVAVRTVGDERWVRVHPVALSADAARRQLQLVDVAFPALPDGAIDRTRPAGRIQLAAVWWERVLDRFRLGFRPRDDQAPRTHLAVRLHNAGDDAINVVVAAQTSHPALRPRLRDATDLDTVRRLVRVPPGRSVAATVPVYVDRSRVPASGVLSEPLTVRVTPLGSDVVLHERVVPIVIERGTPWASALLVLGCVAAMLGWLAIGVGLRRWMRRSTGQLTTIAVFGSLSFTVGAASQLVGLGLSSVLGPFAPFVLGLADDALRMCLVGALLALVPRVGTFALATLIGWLMRALALGSVHPVDAIYLGSAVFWTEGLLWLSGVTRGDRHWLEGRWAWLRLSAGLALPNAVGTATGLAISVVLYRLYYADWYLGATVLLPGLVYATIGCAVAVPFARSLRRVG